MNTPKTLKMLCFIKNYEFWDGIIHEHSLKFHKTYSVYPNIMLAKQETWDKIDEYANLINPGHITNPGGAEEVGEDDLKSISTFTTDEYFLEFCLDDKVKDDYFILVFDETPTFDGEPCDFEENDIIKYKRIA